MTRLAVLAVLLFVPLLWSPASSEDQHTEKMPADQMEEEQKGSTCGCKISLTWKTSLRGSPIVATPFLYDIDMDGFSDIVVATVTGEIWAVHGESGHVIDNWPLYLEGKSFLASPLVFDVNADGTNEIVAVTTDAEIVFIDREGFLSYGNTIKLPPLEAARTWYKLSEEERAGLIKALADSFKSVMENWDRGQPRTSSQPKPADEQGQRSKAEIHKARYSQKSDPLYSRHSSGKRKSGLSDVDPSKVFIDPHVLATPIIVDTNGDGLRDEMIVPVSYYFDPFYYGNEANLHQLNLPKEELKNFVAGAVLNVNLTNGQIIWQKFMGLTLVDSDQAGYMLASPTPLTLSGNPNVDILIGTGNGMVHFLSGLDGTEKKGFPLPVDSVTIPVAVGDADIDGIPDIIVCDNSGNVQCLNLNGKTRWERKLDSHATGVRFGDVDDDNDMDVVVTTKDGTIHVLSAVSGVDRQDAISVGVEMVAPPLLTEVRDEQGLRSQIIVVPSSPHPGQSDHVFVLHPKRKCLLKEPIEVGSYGSILMGNMLPHARGYEYLVALQDGTLLSYSFIQEGLQLTGNRSNLWFAEIPMGNEFTHKSQSVYIVPYYPSQLVAEVTKREFDLKFDILYGGLSPPPSVYTIEVSMGRLHVLYKEDINIGKGSDQFSVSISVPSPHGPTVGHLELRVCTSTNICDNLFYNMRFNVHFEENLQWCLAVPFLCLCLSVLWFLRAEGSPEVGALPTSEQPSLLGSRKTI